MDLPQSAETASKALFMANAMNHVRNNRIEYLVITLLAYSIGFLDKAIDYGTSLCNV